MLCAREGWVPSRYILGCEQLYCNCYIFIWYIFFSSANIYGFNYVHLGQCLLLWPFWTFWAEKLIDPSFPTLLYWQVMKNCNFGKMYHRNIEEIFCWHSWNFSQIRVTFHFRKTRKDGSINVIKDVNIAYLMLCSW